MLLVYLVGISLLLLSSGKILFFILKEINKKEWKKQNKKIYDTGYIVGKCENILIYIMVCMGEFTALALIFSAKSLIRQEDIKKDSLYYLAGSLVNFTYSIIIALLFKDIAKFVPIFFEVSN